MLNVKIERDGYRKRLLYLSHESYIEKVIKQFNAGTRTDKYPRSKKGNTEILSESRVFSTYV